MLTRLGKFLKEQENRIILVVGLVLVSVASFAGGFLEGRSNQESPIVIEKPLERPKNAPSGDLEAKVNESEVKNEALTNSENYVNNTKKECQFVGSKNSDKFHIPTCQWAKRIKPENVVCFESIEKAITQGRVKDGCIK
jgi:hypothetical protein